MAVMDHGGAGPAQWPLSRAANLAARGAAHALAGLVRLVPTGDRQGPDAAGKSISASADEIDDLKKSINSAIRWLAIGAAGIVFELLRKGVTF
jgi:hypothetical protein